MDGNALGGYSTSGAQFGKIWSELKFLYASHITFSETFQNIQFLQNSLALEILDTKNEKTLNEDKLTKLIASLSS